MSSTAPVECRGRKTSSAVAMPSAVPGDDRLRSRVMSTEVRRERPPPPAGLIRGDGRARGRVALAPLRAGRGAEDGVAGELPAPTVVMACDPPAWPDRIGVGGWDAEWARDGGACKGGGACGDVESAECCSFANHWAKGCSGSGAAECPGEWDWPWD